MSVVRKKKKVFCLSLGTSCFHL